jgi:hypothetical protein
MDEYQFKAIGVILTTLGRIGSLPYPVELPDVSLAALNSMPWDELVSLSNRLSNIEVAEEMHLMV